MSTSTEYDIQAAAERLAGVLAAYAPAVSAVYGNRNVAEFVVTLDTGQRYNITVQEA